MQLGKTLRLLAGNFKNVYRLLLYKIVVGVLAMALCYAFILPEIQRLMSSSEIQTLFSDVKAFVKAFVSMDSAGVSAAKNALVGIDGSIREALRFIGGMSSEIAWAVVECVVVLVLKHYIDLIGYFTIGGILNDKMTTYSETAFFSSFIANLGKANVYALVYAPISFVFDAITFILCYICLSVFSVFTAFFTAFTLLVLIQAAKITLLGFCMPAKNIEGKLFAPMLFRSQGGNKGRIWMIYSNYVVSAYLIIIVNVIAAVTTFGSALLLTVPASYMFLICLQYVNYYTVKGKRYFLSYERIEKNPDYTDSQRFFENIGAETFGLSENESDENGEK